MVIKVPGNNKIGKCRLEARLFLSLHFLPPSLPNPQPLPSQEKLVRIPLAFTKS